MYNVLAIAIAAVSNFLLGGLWYSLLFGKTWQQEAGVSNEKIKAHGSTPYIFSLVYSVFAAIGFNYLAMYSTSLLGNVILGAVVGVLLVATSLGVNYQFAGRSNKLFLIDAGYHVAQFLVYSLVFWYVH